MRSFKKEIFIFLSLMILVLPSRAFGHGNQHAFQKVDQDKVIIANFNAEKIQSGLPIIFNFSLFQIDSQPVSFDLVEVQFLEDSHLIKKTIIDKNGKLNVETTFTFPKKGNYVMKAIYLTNGKELAVGEFPIAVEQGLEFSLIERITDNRYLLVASIILIVVGSYAAGLTKLHKKVILIYRKLRKH